MNRPLLGNDPLDPLAREIGELLPGNSGRSGPRRSAPEDFKAALPATARRQLEELHQLICQGRLPNLEEVSFNASSDYAYEFEEHHLPVLDEAGEDASADVFALGSDPWGNKYVLHRSGEVRLWSRETWELEAETDFSSIGAFLYIFVHLTVARCGQVVVQEALDRIAELDEPGGNELIYAFEEEQQSSEFFSACPPPTETPAPTPPPPVGRQPRIRRRHNLHQLRSRWPSRQRSRRPRPPRISNAPFGQRHH